MTPSEPPVTLPPAVTNLNSQLADLTKQLKSIPKVLGPENGQMLLSQEGPRSYINLIQNHQQEVATLITNIENIPHYGHVGNFASAIATASNLTSVRTETQKLLENYHQYLETLYQQVLAAFGITIAEDLG